VRENLERRDYLKNLLLNPFLSAKEQLQQALIAHKHTQILNVTLMSENAQIKA
jgi:hypothetical protein